MTRIVLEIALKHELNLSQSKTLVNEFSVISFIMLVSLSSTYEFVDILTFDHILESKNKSVWQPCISDIFFH